MRARAHTANRPGENRVHGMDESHRAALAAAHAVCLALQQVSRRRSLSIAALVPSTVSEDVASTVERNGVFGCGGHGSRDHRWSKGGACSLGDRDRQMSHARLGCALAVSWRYASVGWPTRQTWRPCKRTLVPPWCSRGVGPLSARTTGAPLPCLTAWPTPGHDRFDEATGRQCGPRSSSIRRMRCTTRRSIGSCNAPATQSVDASPT